MLLTIAKPQQSQATNDYFDGEFDAAIHCHQNKLQASTGADISPK